VSRKTENAGFICIKCGVEVKPLTNGSYRNHCPHCIYSIHIDNMPGDRANDCLGLMKPIGVHFHSKKGLQIVHQCQKCGAEKVNRTAPDDLDAMINTMKSEGFV
jgi:DNA-directed RNA polymerase subunit RPC12/RpoP